LEANLQFGHPVFIERVDFCVSFLDSLLVLGLDDFALGLASFSTLNARNCLINIVK
jgi:hypothetical protein